MAVEPFTTSILVGGGGSMTETMDYLITSGMGRALLDNAPEPARGAAIDAVHDALASRHEGEGVRLGAAALVVTATT